MLHRDRDLIGRIGDLADEAAVLAQHMREPEAHARGALLEHRLEDALIGGDGALLSLLAQRRISHDRPPPPRPAIARLTRPSDGALIENSRSPQCSSAAAQRGSPAMSPQRLTLTPCRRPCAAVRPMSSSTAGLSGSASASSAPLLRSQAVTYCVRSLEPIEKKDAGKRVDRERRRRHLDHHAELGRAPRRCRQRAAPPMLSERARAPPRIRRAR